MDAIGRRTAAVEVLRADCRRAEFPSDEVRGFRPFEPLRGPFPHYAHHPTGESFRGFPPHRLAQRFVSYSFIPQSFVARPFVVRRRGQSVFVERLWFAPFEPLQPRPLRPAQRIPSGDFPRRIVDDRYSDDFGRPGTSHRRFRVLGLAVFLIPLRRTAAGRRWFSHDAFNHDAFDRPRSFAVRRFLLRRGSDRA